MTDPLRCATLFTHRRPSETGPAIDALLALAREHGAVLRLDPTETSKHALTDSEGLELNAPVRSDVDLCFALGGDGTILSALRTYAGTGVPVFAVNYGEIGFLATVDRDEADAGFRRAFAGDYEVLALPGIEVVGGSERWLAINDVSIHRQPGKRVAHLAWGVEGIVVSFIAPHSLTARALVVGPGDELAVFNRSQEEPVDVSVDGRPVFILDPDVEVRAHFVDRQGSLAQLPGTTFYHRLREKFGRLASAP